jgi:hypothetical protein
VIEDMGIDRRDGGACIEEKREHIATERAVNHYRDANLASRWIKPACPHRQAPSGAGRAGCGCRSREWRRPNVI